MGILNVTPDSFADGGRYLEPHKAVAHGLVMAEQGADLLDVGGESTRPGAQPVTAAEQLRRVLPVIEELAVRTRTPISIDTSHPQVMRAAVAAGASIINDVRALREPGALETAAELRVPVCLTHIRGTPQTMQDDPCYRDVVAEVGRFLDERRAACAAAGIAPQHIIIDPGFGFGKTIEHNLSLLRNLRALKRAGTALLVGLSRKSLIPGVLASRLLDKTAASVQLALIALREGADILRVHDVAETRQALLLYDAVYHGAAAPAASS